MKRKRNRSTNLPPLEQRLVFVQFIRRQRCRFNASLAGFHELPQRLQDKVTDKWQMAHPRMSLPDFEVSARKREKL